MTTGNTRPHGPARTHRPGPGVDGDHPGDRGPRRAATVQALAEHLRPADRPPLAEHP